MPWYFRGHVKTNTLIHLLISVKVGELVTYTQLQDTIHAKDMDVVRRYLYSAFRWLERNRKMVFGCKVREGVLRLDSKETVNAAGAKIRMGRKNAIRATKLALLAPDEGLTIGDRQRRDGIINTANFISLVSEVEASRMITSPTRLGNNTVDTNWLFEMFPTLRSKSETNDTK